MIGRFLNDITIEDCCVQMCLANKVISSAQEPDTASLDAYLDSDIFFLGGVSPKIGRARAADDHILKKNYVFFDWDVRKDDPDLTDDDIRDLAKTFLPGILSTIKGMKNWRYIIFTGNGIHVYYFSEEAVIIGDKNAFKMGMRYYIDCLNAIQSGFDEACINVSRLARLPGSYNCKKEKKLVEIIASQDVYSDLLLSLESRGGEKIKDMGDKSKEQAAKVTTGDVYDRINSLPIGEVVAKIMVWDFDGRNFNDPGNEKKKACFVPKGENFIVHGGTDHFPQSASGYSPFTFVRQAKGFTNNETFLWFRSNFPDVDPDAGHPRADVAIPNRTNISDVFSKLKNISFVQLNLTPEMDKYKFIIRGAVTRLGAMSFTGKSRMIYFLTHLLVKNGYKGIIISTEVPAEMVLAHLLQIVVPGARDIWDIIEHTVEIPIGTEEAYRDLDIYDVKDTHNRLDQIEKILDATVRSCKEAASKPPSFMVIDFVQMIMPKSHTNSEFHAASRYAQEVQEMAQRYNVAIIDTSQLGPEGMKDLNAQYGDIPFRNSKDLYNNADIAIMLKRNRDPVEIDNNMIFSIRKHKYKGPAELDMEYNYRNGSFVLHSKIPF